MKSRRGRNGHLELLEDRTLMASGAAASLNDVAIVLGTPGPTTVSGALNPGEELAVYRIDGVAGEALRFHNVSTTSTNGGWSLLNQAGQAVANTNLGTDFTANLSSTGPYYLELQGNIPDEIDYSFQLSDVSSSPVTPQGFNTPHSGTLTATYGATVTYAFQAPAGLPVFFEDTGFQSNVYAVLTDPNNNTVFGSYPSNWGIVNPFVTSTPGQYKLTIYNYTGNSAANYGFNMLALPGAATSIALGASPTTVSGTLNPGSGADVYSFQGAVGQSLFLDNTTTVGNAVNFLVMNPDGSIAFNVNSYSDNGPRTLTQSGTYYLIAAGSSSAPVSYSARLIDTAYSPLNFGTPTNGMVSIATQSDAYTFTGKAGDRDYFQSLGDSNGNGGASWYLYGPNGQYLTSNNIGSDLSATLPTDGQYTLYVYNYASYSTGTYSFEAFQGLNASGGAIALGQSTTGTLANPEDQVTYTFQGTPGQRLFFDNLGLTASGNSTNIVLADPQGNQAFNVGTNSDAGPLTLTNGGTYSLVVTNTSRGSAAYGFRLIDTSTTATAFDATVNGSTTLAGQSDVYTFSGTAGQHVYFEGLTDSTGIYYGHYLSLYGPNNNNVTGNYLGSDLSYTLPTTGTYTAVISNNSGTVPSTYSFKAIANVNSTTALATLGQPTSGTIANPGDTATYTFQGTPGQRILFNSISADSYYLYASLTGPDGTNYFNGTAQSDRGPWTLSQAGTYTLAVYDGYGRTTGNFAFALDDVTIPADAQTSTMPTLTLTPGGVGTVVANTLASGQAIDYYRIDGTAGERLYFLGGNDSPSYAVQYNLYDPGGTNLANNWVESDHTVTLPRTGSYLLTVGGLSQSNAAPSYSFTIYQNTNPTTEASVNQLYSGSLLNPGDSATYTFQLSPGQRVFFDGRSPYIGNLNAALTDPYGNRFFDNAASYDEGPYTMTQADPTLTGPGTYTLTLYSYGTSRATGAYSFSLDDMEAPTALAPVAGGAAATVSGTLASGGSVGWYAIDGKAGEKLYFRGQDSGPYNIQYSLYDAANRNLLNTWTRYDTTYTLPRDGRYLLGVSGQDPSNAAAPYAYNFQVFQVVTSTTALTLNQVTSGAIANPGDSPSYTFAGSAGQTIYFNGQITTSGLSVVLTDAVGHQVFNLNPSSNAGPYTLPTTGTYTLTISGSGRATGGYQFEVLDPSANPIDTGSASAITGTLTPGTEGRAYGFSATAGQAITFQSGSFSSTAGTWSIIDPTGKTIASAAFGTDLAASLGVTGKYALLLQGSDTADASLSYSFTSTLTTPATPPDPAGFNVEHSGTLTANTPTTFTFVGVAGQAVYFNNLIRGYQPTTATLTDPSNKTVFSSWMNYAGNYGPFFLPSSGTYTLSLSTGNSSIPYDFQLIDLAAAATPLTLGTSVGGTLTNGAKTLVYSFSGSQGQTLFLDNTTLGGGVYLALVDPTNWVGFNVGSNSDAGPVTLRNDGTHYLIVDGESSSSTSYGFRLLDVTSSPTTFGQATTATMTTTTQSDVYSFQGTAGQSVLFYWLSQPNGNQYNSSWQLFGPQGQLIASPYYYQDLSATLPSTGRYTLVVYNTQGYYPGTYSFQALQPVNTTTPLTLGQAVSGTLANPGDTASYTFQGTPGQYITFDAQGTYISGLNARLTDPSGNNLFDTTASNDQGGYVLTDGGTYTLTFYGSNHATGAYSFALDDVSQATPIALTPGAGTTVTGALKPGGSLNLYRFSGTAGEHVYFEGLSDSPDYSAYVYFGTTTNGGITSNWAEQDNAFTLPYTGVYYVSVTGRNPSIAEDDYKFTLFANSSPTSALTLGQAVSGTIANPGDSASYTFTGAAGQRIYYDGRSSYVGNLNAVLTDPFGNPLFNNAASYDEGVYTLASAGTYTLTVYSNGTGRATGDYAFNLSDVRSATPATIALTPGAGAIVSGTLPSGGATQFYQFSGTAGQRLYFEGLADSPSYSTQYTLYGPNGNSLFNNWLESDHASYALPATGTYLLAISGQNVANASPSYSLEIFTNSAPTSALTLGQAVSGTIANPGDSASYTFTGAAGQRIYYDGRSSYVGNLNAVLTDPFGNPLFNNAASYDEGVYTLASAGTYTLTVYSNSTGRATGDYAFNLSDVSSATPVTLTPGGPTTVSGTLSHGSDTKLYAISGTAGETITLTDQGSTPTYSAYVSLYNPSNGALVSNNWLDSLNGYSYTLPTTGTYVLSFQGQGAPTSAVNYGLEITQNTVTATPLTLNSEVTGTLANPGDTARYTFAGDVGDLVQFNGLSSSVTYGLARLYDPQGSQVFSQYVGSGSNAGPYLLTRSGTYTLVVSTNGQYTGPFDFRLLGLAAEPKLQVNTTEADLTVSLSAPQAQQVLVSYATQDDSAAAGTDYRPASGLILFQPGQTTATIPLQAIDQSGAFTRDFQVVLSNPVGVSIGSGTGTVTISATGQGTLTGRVFDDQNGSGTPDGSEPGLAGWTVQLLDGSNNVIATATTDPTGAYRFSNVAPGTYKVAEVLQSGYLQSSPPASLSPDSVTLSAGQTVGHLDIGAFRAVTLSGQVFNDLTGTAAYAAGDDGLSGRTIDLLDLHGGVVAQATTDSQGHYAFAGVGGGIYSIRQEVAAGSIQTTATTTYPVRVAAEQDQAGFDFGDFVLGTISGEVFNDLDNSGTLKDGDPGLSGWIVELTGGDDVGTVTTTVYPGYTDQGNDITFSGTPLGTLVTPSILFDTQTGDNWHPFGAGGFGTDSVGTLNVANTGTYTFTLRSDDGAYLFIDGQLVVNYGGQHGDGTASGNATLSAGLHSFEVKFFENGAGGSGLDLYLPTGVSSIRATTTDANGQYTFTGLGPGTYTATLIQQPKFGPSTPTSLLQAVTSGLVSTGHNFGQYQTLTLSGTAYNDLNGDGSQGATEPGLGGWTVDLIDGASNVVATATTGNDGHYILHAPSAGTYTVREETPAGYLVTSPAGGGYSTTVSDATSVGGLDFGNFKTIAISGKVFTDINGDGAFQAGETPLVSWTVDLLNGSGQTIASTFTSSNGDYRFGGYPFSGLGPGTYSVAVEARPGYVASLSPSNLPAVAVSGGDLGNENFGEFETVSLTGEVFDDSDGSGSLNGAEAGLSGWTVGLYSGSTLQASTQTDAQGHYAFSNVGAGSYSIQVTPQAGYVATIEQQNVTTSSGLDLSGLNLGEAVAGTVSGQVFIDNNGDGTLNGADSGLANWQVVLSNTSNGSYTVTKTDGTGRYSFGSVAPGTYQVSIGRAGGDVVTKPSTYSYTIALAEGLTAAGYDFGYFQGVSLSGRLYNDANDNGQPDTGETSLSGWTVSLYSGANLLASTTTDTNGHYAFGGVGPGSFTITEAVNSGFVATAGASRTVTTSSGQDVTGLDFGDVQGETLTGRVYNDNNGDGLFNGPDAGLSGVTVDVFDSSNALVGAVATDGTGTYTFTTLVAGTYTLKPVVGSSTVVTAPAGGQYSQAVSAGQAVSGLDFGVFRTVTLSGTVYNDDNGDGSPNGPDSGLFGWTVQLLDASNNVVGSAQTDATGAYSFGNVKAGAYSLQVVPLSGYVTTSAGTLGATAASGQNVSGLNFGEFRRVNVGGEVFTDNNGDGQVNGADAGLSGWTVSLYDAANNLITSTPTDASGLYSFPNLGPGRYSVAVTPRAGFVGTPATTIPFSTHSAQDITAANFGQFQAVSLGGEVYLDADGDGKLGQAETGLSGWTVRLVNTANNQAVTVPTGTGGAFSFAGVGPGSYSVQVVSPAGYVATTAPLSVTTASGQNVSGLDLGEFQAVSISGQVYNDADDDGLLDHGESGLAGWTVNLRNNTTGAVVSAPTDGQGGFTFTGVGPGQYTVSESLQAGYVQTQPSTGGIVVGTSSGSNVAGESFGVILGPVLSVTNLTPTPMAGLTSGATLQLSWDDLNSGGLPIKAPFTDVVTITNATTGQVLANLPVTFTPTAAGVAVGGSAHQATTYTLPDGAAGVGNIRFTVTADASGSASNGLPASGRTASTSVASTLANYADLIVSPGSLLVSPMSPQSGGQITVSWTDKNQGDGAVNAAFNDYVLAQKVNGDGSLTYLDSTFVAGSPALGAGALSGTQTAKLNLPNGTDGTGTIRVTVVTDLGQAVKEYDPSGNPAYGNNSATTDVASSLAPSPDLVVTNIVVNNGSNAQVLPGQAIPVAWTDLNQGAASASGNWIDQVFLADDPAGTKGLQLLANVPVSASLSPSNGVLPAPAGSTVAASTSITIPATAVGTKYVVVRSGLSESFYEFNPANNASVSTSSVVIPPSIQVSLAAPGSRTFSKNAANPATTATVTRNDTNVGALTVTITSGNPAAVLLSARPGDVPSASIQVTIPDGSYSALFYVDAVQDNLVDGTQTSAITPAAGGYLPIADTATELETNGPALKLTLSAGTFASNSGVTATLTRNTNSANPNDAALTVAITSSDPTVATAPATVVIPAGQGSVTFPITGVPTDLLVASRIALFTTSAPVDPVTGRAFSASAAQATVTDANTPTLTLTPDTAYVEENAANPATFVTLGLTDGQGNPLPLPGDITVALQSNDPADLTLPATVTVPAGSASVRVPLTVLNNPKNNNPIVTLSAYGVDALTGLPIAQGHAATTITVLNTTQPYLAISAPVSIGVAAGQAQASVSIGNTPAISPVTVYLTSSDTGEATAPSSVIVPSGATSVPFLITVPANAKGGTVTISATSAGYNMGAQAIAISTSSLPDPSITAGQITLPNSPPLTDELNYAVSWQVTNVGNSTASGLWNDHLVLSTDPAGRNVVFQHDYAYMGGPLAAGASYTNSNNPARITLPHYVGTYYLTVTTDYSTATRSIGAVAEITPQNDSATVPVSVGAAYYATLQVGSKLAAAGSPLTVSGNVLNAADGTAHTGGAILYVAVSRNGRSLEQDGPLFANPDGTWSYTFAPGSSAGSHFLDAGDYQFFALTNGQQVDQIPDQSKDTATVLGMSAAPSPAAITVVPGTATYGTTTITNLSSVPLTHLYVAGVDQGTGDQKLPVDVTVTLNGATLPGSAENSPGQVTASYAVAATWPIAVRGQVFVTLNDDQGVPLTFEIDPTIAPPTPVLTATAVKAGVVVGTQVLASFTLTNIGSANTGPIDLASALDWVTPASVLAPIAPGQSEVVQVMLAPPEDQAPGRLVGALTAGYGSTGVPVPFTIDVTSDQHGSLTVIADDEATTSTEAGGHLAGAYVQVIDPATNATVASGKTTASGLTLPGVTAGTYELEVTDDKHSTFTSPITINPGANEADVFLHIQAVTYSWTVVPTTIPDHYTIQLQADFVTQVPIPNLVPDKPFVMPLIGEGGSARFVEHVTNQGLIAATNVQIGATSNATFTVTPLVTTIPVLPAQTQYDIPVLVTANAGRSVQDFLHSDDCCNLPEVDISYSYVAKDPVEQVRQVKVDPVFVTSQHYADIQKDWGGNSPAFSDLTPDLFNGPDNGISGTGPNSGFISTVLTHAVNPTITDFHNNPNGTDLPQPQQQLLTLLANGVTGDAAQIVSNLSAMLGGLCSITSTGGGGVVIGGGGGGGGGITGGIGGGGGGGRTYYTPFTWTIPTTTTTRAQVRVEIDQDAVFTRDAFRGTLRLDNSDTAGLSDVQVQLDVQTVPGPNGVAQESTDKFFFQAPQLTGFGNGQDGLWTLGGANPDGSAAEGTAQYLIIPTQDAAPTTAIQYAIGGTLSYRQADGSLVVVPLLPAQITVQPSPNLVLNYFWQQQAEGQDALTPNKIQPSVPFPLGLQVTNIGAGPANDFRITSAQPKIVENAQGLLVGFHIDGTTVNGQAASPSLQANLGNVLPGKTSTAAFLLESTLAGYFQNFTATYQHDNALGGAATSLINGISVHNLVHMVQAGYVGNPKAAPVQDDGVQDFLVSDLPGSLGAPDGLWLSDGTQQPVSPASDVSVVGVSGRTYQITATMPAGWSSLRLVDPTGGNLVLGTVTRGDGLGLRVGSDTGDAGNVWDTVQNITSDGFVTAETDLHLLDYNATPTTVTYLVTYVNPKAVTPTITQLGPIKPSTVGAPFDTVDVTFNVPIDLNTFTPANLTLSLNDGPNLIDAKNVSISLVSGTTSTYRISGLAALAATDGRYSLTVSASGVPDALGDAGAGTLTASWTLDSAHANVGVQDVAAITNAAVTHLTVVFSAPINAATFTTDDLGLSFNDGANLITPASGVTITDLGGGKFDVALPASLTSADGAYAFSVNPQGVLDSVGNSVVGADATRWTMDATPPAITALQQPQTPRNIVVPTLVLTFSEPIDSSTFTPADLSLTRTVGGVTTANLLDGRVTIEPDTGFLVPPNSYIIKGISWPQAIQGTYTFTVGNGNIKDLAGNLLKAPATATWYLSLTMPAAPSNLAIAPDSGPNPSDGGRSELTSSTAVTFTGSVDPNTVEVRLEDVTTSTYLGDAFLNGLAFSRTLNLSPGFHQLSAQAFDAASNGSSPALFNVFVDQAPPVVTGMAQVVPNPPAAPLDTETVVLSKPVQAFDWTALGLTLNGSPVALNSTVKVTPVAGAAVPTYRISGLAPFTAASGQYVLTVDATRLVDFAGNNGFGTGTVTWQQVQTIAQLSITDTVDNPSPHEGGPVKFTVTLTDAAAAAGATNLSITDLLPAGLTLVSASPSTGSYSTTTGVWAVPSLAAGSSARLTLLATVNFGTAGQTLKDFATITGLDQANSGSPTSAEADVAVAPSARAATDVAISPDTGSSTTDGVTNTGSVTISGTVPNNSGTTVDVFDTATSQDLGLANLNAGSFRLPLTLAEGTHPLRLRTALNGTTADAVYTVLVDRTTPASSVANNLGATQSSDDFTVSVNYSDPNGASGAAPSGVATIALYYSVNGSATFNLWGTQTIVASASGTVGFLFHGQDRNTYAFHSVVTDAAGNVEPKNPSLSEALTKVPNLNPPVTHVIAPSPAYSWGPFSPSLFSGVAASSYDGATGLFTLNWAGADPDATSGTPPGSLASVAIYVSIDGLAPVSVGAIRVNPPNGSGVYSGSTTYQALGDNTAHTYAFYSVGTDDLGKAQAAPAQADLSLGVTYKAPLAVSNFSVEKNIAERSYIRYLDVTFNQSPGALGLQPGGSPTHYVELLYYGRTPGPNAIGSVTLFGGASQVVTLSGNLLSFDFGPKGMTSLLSTGAGLPTNNTGDGWYALGIQPNGDGSSSFWLPFFRLFGDTNGDGKVTGPYTTPGTDAAAVYAAQGKTGALLNADLDGNNGVNTNDLVYVTNAYKANSTVSQSPPTQFPPQFQILAGPPRAPAGGATPIVADAVRALLPQAVAAWQAAGLDAAGAQRLRSVPVAVAALGTSVLGIEAGGQITINQTAAGDDWYVGASRAATGPADALGRAPMAPVPAGKADLLTVLEHELGHVLGLPDNSDPSDLMDTTLAAGVRRSPSVADVMRVLAAASTPAPTSGAPILVAPLPNGDTTRRSLTSAPGFAGPIAVHDAALDAVAGPGVAGAPSRDVSTSVSVSSTSIVRRTRAAVPSRKAGTVGAKVQAPPFRRPIFSSRPRRPGPSPAAETPDLTPID